MAIGEITRTNKIGNVDYRRGPDSEAAPPTQEALADVEPGRTTERSRARLRKITSEPPRCCINGSGPTSARSIVREIVTGDTMRRRRSAAWIDRGWLFRRLGDPIQAMQTYRQAQALFARAQHYDGQISVWRNIGSGGRRAT